MTIERRNHGRGHSYRIDGVKVPGVTTIIGATTAKPALIEWAGKTTAAYAVDHRDELADLPPSKVLERLNKARYEDKDTAASRGTEVHRLAEAYIRGEAVDVPDELDGHVRAYETFVADWQVREVLVEAVVGNRAVGYCGTVDLVADLVDGHRWLLDIKTSRSGIFPETALQLCAYRRAEFYAVDDDDTLVEHSIEDLGITRVGAIHVRSDSYELRPVATDDATFDYFRHLAWLYRRLDDQQEWIGRAIPAPRRRAEATA